MMKWCAVGERIDGNTTTFLELVYMLNRMASNTFMSPNVMLLGG